MIKMDGFWNLEIENIGIFKNFQKLEFKEGVNWIIGENASGKTTIINCMKLLNILNTEENLNFLNDKGKNGKVELKNGHLAFNNIIISPINFAPDCV